MIVNGDWRGYVAVIEDWDRKKEKVFARILTNGEIITASFDDACGYLGDMDE